MGSTPLMDEVCCPLTGQRLETLEPWLYGIEDGDSLYPSICGTPVLQPHIEAFLQEEQWTVARAIAELGETGAVRDWYFSRYGGLQVPDPAPVDTEILGEGYPGFWQAVSLPAFLRDWDLQAPEDLVVDMAGLHRCNRGLDLGCGQGGMTQRMAQTCRRVFGLETNFYLAAKANRLLKASEIQGRYFIPEMGTKIARIEKVPVANATVICGDYRMPPFREPVFDWVHLGHILDLAEDPAEVVIGLKRIMKPGGLLSICSPWDFRVPGHFDNLLEILQHDFREIGRIDGIPWLRFHHKRRLLVHEDWVWVGKLRR